MCKILCMIVCVYACMCVLYTGAAHVCELRSDSSICACVSCRIDGHCRRPFHVVGKAVECTCEKRLTRNGRTRTTESQTIIYFSAIVNGMRRQRHLVYSPCLCALCAPNAGKLFDGVLFCPLAFGWVCFTFVINVRHQMQESKMRQTNKNTTAAS